MVRRVFELLRQDFEDRCAYSMQHYSLAGGLKCMEIDHFNPKRKNDPVQDYGNLFLSTRHVNGSKRAVWPSYEDRLRGARFLNCCEEPDYGVHIFEDPDTHEVVGVSPAGRYHIRNCDLNAPHLVQERLERAHIRALLQSQFRIKRGQGWDLPEAYQALKDIVERMIPSIPYLAGAALIQRRYLRQALEQVPISQFC
jgi:hypothetical protein